MSNKIITIGREFASGGRLIGKELADRLGVTYYDKNILDHIAEKNGYSVEMIEEDERRAKNGFFYSLSNAFGAAGYGPDTLSINEKFFIAQFEYILELAKEGNGGVIVGRCADYVLRDFDDAVNVFIFADEASKIKRATEVYGLNADDVKKYMGDMDKARANYYKYHTGQKWGEMRNYDLSIDSSNLREKDVADLILKYVDMRYKA